MKNKKRNFEETLEEKGVTYTGCLIEISRQLKRIADSLNGF